MSWAYYLPTIMDSLVKHTIMGLTGNLENILPEQKFVKKVVASPVAYKRLIEFNHFDIQSTWQKSEENDTANELHWLRIDTLM